MKWLKIYFAGLVVLLFLASCNLRPGANGGNSTSLAPTSTPTLTETTTPSPQPTPTRRATLIVYLTPTRGPSLTPRPLVTPIPSDIVLTIQAQVTESRYLTGGGPYSCKLLSTKPAELEVMRPREQFGGSFRISNIGKAPWDDRDVAYFFISGTRFQTQKYKESYIPYRVEKGEEMTLHIPMHAPPYPGVYFAIWGLRVQHLKQFFCTFPMIILVEEKPVK